MKLALCFSSEAIRSALGVSSVIALAICAVAWLLLSVVALGIAVQIFKEAAKVKQSKVRSNLKSEQQRKVRIN